MSLLFSYVSIPKIMRTQLKRNFYSISQSDTPTLFHMPSPGIYVGDFISREACEQIISTVASLEHWTQAKVTIYERDSFGKGQIKSVLDKERRVCSRIHFSDLDLDSFPLLISYLAFVQSEVMSLLQAEYNLQVQEMGEAEIVHYPSGGMFMPHSDANRVKPYRAFSVILYLNEDFDGGETQFPDSGYTCSPKTGRVLVFPSYLVHAGQTVLAGEKYVLVMWIFYPGSQGEYSAYTLVED